MKKIEKIDNNIDYFGIDYINCGFEIISSFQNLISYLNDFDLPKNSISEKIKMILNNKSKQSKPNLNELRVHFNKINYTQNFICFLIQTINNELMSLKKKNLTDFIYKNENYNPKNEKTEYNNFVKDKHIYPQSKIYSIFTIMTRKYFNVECSNCQSPLYKNIFDNKIDFLIDLDLTEKSCKFNDLLKKIINKEMTIEEVCRCKKKNKLKKNTTKFIKLPEILIFTLKRFNNGKINKVKIEPEPSLNLTDYIDYQLDDKRAEYNLFAINSMKEINNDLKPICKIKKDKNWYTIGYENENNFSNEISFEFFYKKKDK